MRRNTVVELSVDAIVNGRIMPVIEEFFNESDLKPKIREKLKKYLDFIKKRATGEFLTLAHWMREFVENHPDYAKDSAVSQQISYDLMNEMRLMMDGKQSEQSVF